MTFASRSPDSWVCPSCLRRIGRADIGYRCVGEPDRCAGDRRLAAADPRAPSAVCGSCGRTTARRHCRRCQERLPEGYPQARSRVVVFAGPAGSGKSTLLAVLLHELRHRLGEELGVALLPCDDRTIATVERAHERPLYAEGRLPARRTPGRLVHRLGRGGGWRARAMTLVLLDTSGERLEADSPGLAAADAVLLLLDPGELPGGGARPAGLVRALDRTLAPLRAARRPLDGRGRIGIPVAVTLTKLDRLSPHLPPQSPLHRRRPPGPGFDPVDRSAVDAELRALLALWRADGVDRLLHENCADHQLFAVSALGAAPRDDAPPSGGPRPLRVEDPLLWLLHRFGFLDRVRHGR